METEYKRLSIEDVVIDWGLAEVRGLLGRGLVDAELVARVEAGIRTASGLQRISMGIKCARGRFLTHFVDFPVPGCEARFDLAETRFVRLHRWFEQQPRYRCLQTLEDLSRVNDDYQIRNFDLNKLIGRVVFLATGSGGPWCIFEGTHRCCTLIRLADEKREPDKAFDVIVGVDPSVTKWLPWWKWG